ncbi:TPA: type II toxin-antitoxin system Phd/YefM family antitoxin [Morganella morganii]|uniref:type II toxin-antitoxin system Phd/YefM family antitoxin n=1 Tax=Morganella morganii TaxID=582 RepID=UPI001C42C291|nr:type II toxin-antitoxin system Phd/YefM family antitoxin [Morganella morganii]MCU6236695.1 type II toxin-antitoxin system Phd/YefM family antitoxin [Morganella morganii]HBH7051850.1 type II toxin-antitoxin system Phd/YefM family antitoxin [Morganella morganii]HBH7054523.1 type II toxin-antitoxin system Phd/YefM family antitoxin [Morganella morganii]HEI9844368.1 type II toxin-antitoxin system Phd/YefM family antitoxin [Morganella morganii]
MVITTIPSKVFNQDIGAAKKAANCGAVFITNRGKPTHVLLSIKDYQKMTSSDKNIVDLLAMPPELADIEFEAPKLNSGVFKTVDFE